MDVACDTGTPRGGPSARSQWLGQPLATRGNPLPGGGLPALPHGRARHARHTPQPSAAPGFPAARRRERIKRLTLLNVRRATPETSPATTGKAGSLLLLLAGLGVFARTAIAGGPPAGYLLSLLVFAAAAGAAWIPWGRSSWMARAWMPALALLAAGASAVLSPDPSAASAAVLSLSCVAPCVYTGLLCPRGWATGTAVAAGLASFIGMRDEMGGHAVVVAVAVIASGAILGELVAYGLTPSRTARLRAQRRADMLSAVADASRRLHRRDFGGVVEGLLEGVRRMGFPGVALVSFDHARPIELGDQIPHLDDLVESVKLRARPVAFPPIEESGRRSGPIAGVPVWLGADVRAALVVRGLPGHVVDHTDLEALELFADQAGRALENARAAERDRRRVAELTDVALRDELTGLGNRRHGVEVLDGVVASDVIAVVDVDGLKQTNDTYGHAMGDQILAALGEYLRDQVRMPDEVARIGGDEFLIVLRRASDTAATVLERLRAGWAARANGTTLSIGMAVHHASVESSETMRMADEALYVAKRGGRNNVQVFGAERSATPEGVAPGPARTA